MWRFKASKFKNASPKIPKREQWISDIPAGNIVQSFSNHIQASAAYMTFNTELGGGGNLGVLPMSISGRQVPGSLPLLRAHADNVTDFKFSPFSDHCLATASQDGMVKIWQLPDWTDSEHFSVVNPLVTLSAGERGVETVTWQPTVSGILLVTTDRKLSLLNIKTEQNIVCLDCHNDQIQSCSWRADGSVFVTSCKDKKIRIIDPRAQSTVLECMGHNNMRDSRVVWLGDKDLVLSSGFDRMRGREVCLRDTRDMSNPITTKCFDTASGVMMPQYDPDTSMLFMAGKGDTYVRYMEVTDKDLVENRTDNVEQIKGLCLVPKRALDVMACEVNKLLILSQQAILPLSYYVPRKFLSDFHEDLFPDTNSTEPALTADEWLAGKTENVKKISLNPSAKQDLVSTQVLLDQPNVQPVSKPAQDTASEPHSDFGQISKPDNQAASDEQHSEKPSVTVRGKSKVFSAVYQSKFRHLEAVPFHKSHNIENIRNLSHSIPGESDMFRANVTFCAVPLGGPGGLIAILKVDEPCRLPDTGIPALQNSSLVTDFVWDPFDDHTLAVACDDAKIKIWKIPEGGLSEMLTEPDTCLLGHTEKIYFVCYHPLASGVLASGSYDMTVRIWDLGTGSVRIQLEGHTDTIFCLSWSPDGTKCATVCKDGYIRMYEPRRSVEPIQTGTLPAGTRGARVVWACEGKLLLVVGFEKSSDRSIRVYNSKDLTTLLHKEELDISPTILVPHYDEDGSTLFLTGRGENTVKTYEVVSEEPYLYPLSHQKFEGLHQALAFLPKSSCDVSKVQFARALRLTNTSIEHVAFTVPRMKVEYFQDDLFPDTRVMWEPSVTGSEWFSGVDRQPRKICLRPENMKLLSDAPVIAPKPKKFETYSPISYKTDEQKKEELLNAMLNKFEVSDEPLPQDLTEGVDEEEWDD